VSDRAGTVPIGETWVADIWERASMARWLRRAARVAVISTGDFRGFAARFARRLGDACGPEASWCLFPGWQICGVTLLAAWVSNLN